mgnify:CR=1 FL=1
MFPTGVGMNRPVHERPATRRGIPHGRGDEPEPQYNKEGRTRSLRLRDLKRIPHWCGDGPATGVNNIWPSVCSPWVWG